MEDEREFDAPIEFGKEAPPPDINIAEHENVQFQNFLTRFMNIKDTKSSFSLRKTLVDHLWEKYFNTHY